MAEEGPRDTASTPIACPRGPIPCPRSHLQREPRVGLGRMHAGSLEALRVARPEAVVSWTNEWVVPLKRGEAYQIIVEHRSRLPVCMRLLVDGLNTLPERERTKGVVTEVWGMPVNLQEARHY